MGRFMFQLGSFITFCVASGIFIWPMLNGGTHTDLEGIVYFLGCAILFGVWVIEDKVDEVNRNL